MAVTRNNICKNGMDSLSRGEAVAYYASVFLYFWVFSTPIVSLVFGSYLYICINWLHLHFDEAFSSLRIANYKSFTRFHINSKGDLEIFTLAVDKVWNDFYTSKSFDLISWSGRRFSYAFTGWLFLLFLISFWDLHKHACDAFVESWNCMNLCRFQRHGRWIQGGKVRQNCRKALATEEDFQANGGRFRLSRILSTLLGLLTILLFNKQ